MSLKRTENLPCLIDKYLRSSSQEVIEIGKISDQIVLLEKSYYPTVFITERDSKSTVSSHERGLSTPSRALDTVEKRYKKVPEKARELLLKSLDSLESDSIELERLGYESKGLGAFQRTAGLYTHRVFRYNRRYSASYILGDSVDDAGILDSDDYFDKYGGNFIEFVIDFEKKRMTLEGTLNMNEYLKERMIRG